VVAWLRHPRATREEDDDDDRATPCASEREREGEGRQGVAWARQGVGPAQRGREEKRGRRAAASRAIGRRERRMSPSALFYFPYLLFPRFSYTKF
jgi:hypothetical protein